MTVTAASGHAKDIQDAIDLAAAEYTKDVFLPADSFPFYEAGETWIPVTVDLALFPSGINLLGAPTPRDAYDQVIDWRTTLLMVEDQPNDTTWFRFLADGDPNKLPRFSDVKLVGYRDIDPISPTRHVGLYLSRAMDFRADHCCFRHTCEGALAVNGLPTRGVIDHNRLENVYNIVWSPYETRTVSYGIYPRGDSTNTFWEDDINKVLGNYTNYTVFVENNYLQGWRHCVASNYGMHYVFRYNTIQYDPGYGSIDAHGKTAYVGTRAIEVYGNQLLDSTQNRDAVWLRGGGGVFFDNTVRGYRNFVVLVDEGDTPKYYPHNIWIWNNNLASGVTLKSGSGIQDVDYFLHAMPSYIPYPWPHPLISGIRMHTLNVRSTPITGVPFTIRRV